jgi:HEAT repeat protein
MTLSEEPEDPVIYERPLSAWIADLGDADRHTRYTAARTLNEASEEGRAQFLLPALPALVRAANDPDREVRFHAVAALGQVGPAAVAATPVLAAAAKNDADEHVRYAAAQGLVSLGQSAEAVVALIGVVEDPDSDEWRVDAINKLGKMGAAGRPAVPALRRSFRDPDWHVCMAAAWAVKGILPEEEAIAMLIDVRALENPAARKYAATVLGDYGTVGEPAAGALERLLLQDPDPAVRGAGVAALGDIRAGSRRVSAALREALKDPAPGVRVEAAGALGRIDTQASESLGVLGNALSYADADARSRAVFYLSRFSHPGAKQLIPGLIDILKRARSDDPDLANAAKALGRIGPDAVAPLVELLRSPNLEHHLGAVWALGAVGQDARGAVPVLITILDREKLYKRSETDQIWLVPGSTIFALSEIVGPDDRIAVPYLIKALELEDATTRYKTATIRGLGNIGPDAAAALPALRKASQEKDQAVREAAIDAMKRIQSRTRRNSSDEP